MFRKQAAFVVNFDLRRPHLKASLPLTSWKGSFARSILIDDFENANSRPLASSECLQPYLDIEFKNLEVDLSTDLVSCSNRQDYYLPLPE